MHRGLVVAVLASCVLAGPSYGQGPQAWAPQRTADGHPDLQGVWATRFVTRTVRPKAATTLNVSPQDAPAVAQALVASSNPVTDPDFAFHAYDQLARVRGEYRSSLIVEPSDGQIPYSEAGRALAEKVDTRESYGFDNPEDRPTYERCLSGILAAPIRTLPMLIPIQIVQTPDAIVMRNEDVQGLRIVPVSRSFGAAGPFDGVSRAHWKDDTLVVETTGFKPDDVARYDMGPPILLSPATRITESFTRISQSELLYEFSVEDAGLYTQPWRAEYVMELEKGGAVHEYACHEGNQSIVGILTAARLGRQDKPPAN